MLIKQCMFDLASNCSFISQAVSKGIAEVFLVVELLGKSGYRSHKSIWKAGLKRQQSWLYIDARRFGEVSLKEILVLTLHWQKVGVKEILSSSHIIIRSWFGNVGLKSYYGLHPSSTQLYVESWFEEILQSWPYFQVDLASKTINGAKLRFILQCCWGSVIFYDNILDCKIYISH